MLDSGVTSHQPRPFGYGSPAAVLQPSAVGRGSLRRLHPKHTPNHDLLALHVLRVALERHVDERPRAPAIKHGALQYVLDLGPQRGCPLRAEFGEARRRLV